MEPIIDKNFTHPEFNGTLRLYTSNIGKFSYITVQGLVDDELREVCAMVDEDSINYMSDLRLNYDFSADDILKLLEDTLSNVWISEYKAIKCLNEEELNSLI